jgi:hypothetical protein
MFRTSPSKISRTLQYTTIFAPSKGLFFIFVSYFLQAFFRKTAKDVSRVQKSEKKIEKSATFFQKGMEISKSLCYNKMK